VEIWLALSIAMVSVVVGGLLTWTIGKNQQHHLIRRLKDMVLRRERVSVNEDFRMTQLLAEHIQKANYVPNFIFAICLGGAMVAEWLSRRFLGDFYIPVPVRLVHVITERSAGGITSIKARVDDKATTTESGLSEDSKVLLVNDISRSGHTLEAAYEFLKSHFADEKIKTATLFCHKYSSAIPTFYVAMTERVIRFEWKQKEM
jgi:hypoxanthine phosphoribosyltransferase